jgi:hypothetical protein
LLFRTATKLLRDSAEKLFRDGFGRCSEMASEGVQRWRRKVFRAGVQIVLRVVVQEVFRAGVQKVHLPVTTTLSITGDHGLWKGIAKSEVGAIICKFGVGAITFESGLVVESGQDHV